MITEISTFQLKDDANLADADSPATKVVRKFLASEVASSGAHEACYGQDAERKELVFIFVNWDSVDDHKNFMSSPDTKPHIEELRTVMDTEKGFTVLHVPFTPSDNPATALGADRRVGVTQVVLNYVPSYLTPEDKDGIMSAVQKLRPVIDHSGAIGVFDGWAVEEAVPNPAPHAFKAEKSQVYVNLVGWPDIETHMRFQETDDFKQNIHLLLGLKEMRHNELYHVKCYVL